MVRINICTKKTKKFLQKKKENKNLLIEKQNKKLLSLLQPFSHIHVKEKMKITLDKMWRSY